jgi:hypothetical protein
MQAEINIIQAYPLLAQPHGHPVIAVMVDSVETALETLTQKGFTLVNEDDLAEYGN